MTSAITDLLTPTLPFSKPPKNLVKNAEVYEVAIPNQAILSPSPSNPSVRQIFRPNLSDKVPQMELEKNCAILSFGRNTK